MSKAEVKWVENYLIPMKAAGLVEPEEERRQWVFHIMVSNRYTDPDDRTGDKTEVAQSGRMSWTTRINHRRCRGPHRQALPPRQIFSFDRWFLPLRL